MTNVIPIRRPLRPGKGYRQALLLDNFANRRRSRTDVFWLKENAEALNVLVGCDARLPEGALDIYADFYDTIAERMRFFPQYYRFLLSICLDLEDLGMPGGQAEALCHQVARDDCAAAELSDLQRAETRSLLSRRILPRTDTGLDTRLRAFIDTPQTFALPNKKAAYELTHIVFYLTGYGRRSPDLPRNTITSLEYAGLLAWLDQDVDLLAEVCVALRFAGTTPSDIWEDWLARQVLSFALLPDSPGTAPDAYHEYLVTSWWAAQAGMEGFCGTPDPDGMTIRRTNPGRGPLRAMSEFMYHLGPARSSDWDKMRGRLQSVLAAEDHNILEVAERSVDRFDAFFAGFARAD